MHRLHHPVLSHSLLVLAAVSICPLDFTCSTAPCRSSGAFSLSPVRRLVLVLSRLWAQISLRMKACIDLMTSHLACLTGFPPRSLNARCPITTSASSHSSSGSETMGSNTRARVFYTSTCKSHGSSASNLRRVRSRAAPLLSWHFTSITPSPTLP